MDHSNLAGDGSFHLKYIEFCQFRLNLLRKISYIPDFENVQGFKSLQHHLTDPYYFCQFWGIGTKKMIYGETTKSFFWP